MNKVIFKGNIANNIEKRTTKDGKDVATFNLAIRRSIKNKEGNYEADFIKCVAFGNNATLITKYFQKGSGIIIEGQLRTGSYEKNGEKVYTTEVIVERVEFVDKLEKNPYEEMSKKVEEDFEFPF